MSLPGPHLNVCVLLTMVRCLNVDQIVAIKQICDPQFFLRVVEHVKLVVIKLLVNIHISTWKIWEQNCLYISSFLNFDLLAILLAEDVEFNACIDPWLHGDIYCYFILLIIINNVHISS